VSGAGLTAVLRCSAAGHPGSGHDSQPGRCRNDRAAPACPRVAVDDRPVGPVGAGPVVQEFGVGCDDVPPPTALASVPAAVDAAERNRHWPTKYVFRLAAPPGRSGFHRCLISTLSLNHPSAATTVSVARSPTASSSNHSGGASGQAPEPLLAQLREDRSLRDPGLHDAQPVAGELCRHLLPLDVGVAGVLKPGDQVPVGQQPLQPFGFLIVLVLLQPAGQQRIGLVDDLIVALYPRSAGQPDPLPSTKIFSYDKTSLPDNI
jgi:hypothetical protein